MKDDGKKILDLNGPIKFKSPLDVVETNFELRGVSFPEPGVYRFEFMCDNIPVISRKFRIVKDDSSKP